MNTLNKIYSDSEEIDRAWNEMVQSIKPVAIIKIPSNYCVPGDPKAAYPIKKKRLHHPALVTKSDFNNWEFLG